MNIGEIYNIANGLNLRQKSIERLIYITRKNNDRTFLMDSNHRPILQVSPMITGKTGTKQLVTIFKDIGLYNMLLDRYDEKKKVWVFLGFTNRSKIIKTEIEKNGYSKPITFAEAVIIALVNFKNMITKVQLDEVLHTKFMENETELEPIEDIISKLNELDNICSK